MTSVLETEYIDPIRPFAQTELLYLKNKTFKYLRIGNVRAHHKQCDHFYNVKENGRKAREMKENNNDIGNCSVCWKFNRTPKHLKINAHNLISDYNNHFFKDPEIRTHYNTNIENSFYIWLYEEFN